MHESLEGISMSSGALLPYEQIDRISNELRDVNAGILNMNPQEREILEDRLGSFLNTYNQYYARLDEGENAYREGDYCLAIDILDNYRNYSGSPITGGNGSFGILLNKNTLIEWLDPIGHAYEKLGLQEKGKQSRILNARLLTTRGLTNYWSAGQLYEAAGEYSLAQESFQQCLDEPGIEYGQAHINEITEKIKELRLRST